MSICKTPEILRGWQKVFTSFSCSYLQVMSDSAHGIDVEIDSDFFYDFANLLEVLMILSPDKLDQEITHFKP